MSLTYFYELHIWPNHYNNLQDVFFWGGEIQLHMITIFQPSTRYPSHSVSVKAKRWEKERMLTNLKKSLSNDAVEGVVEYFVSLPTKLRHNHRIIGAARRVHPKLREKIHELVQEDGITNVRVIKKYLKKQVKEMCKCDPIQPDINDRAYNPLNRDVINCVHSAIVAGKHSQLDLI